MWAFVLLTVAFVLTLFGLQGYGYRQEIIENWAKYRTDPRYLFTAFLYKPATDPRSRLQFTADNFNDVLMASLMNTFKIFLSPVFQIFQLFMNAVMQTLGGLVNIHGLLRTMWKHFMQMIEIFMRRYAATFHRLRMTYNRLFTALARTWAMAMTTVWQGISTMHAIRSFIDLIIIICIVILVILVVIVLIFWLFLWPIIPVLLFVIAIITMAGLGAAVGGMGASLCFDPSTQVEKDDGTKEYISNLRAGDVLKGGNRITAYMKLKNQGGFYSLHGITVSGSHIVYENGAPMLVRDHPQATPIDFEQDHICCLNTVQHTIPVWSPVLQQVVEFADWEEISEETLAEWHQMVFETLNPGQPIPTFTESQLGSDPLVSPDCSIETPTGFVPLQNCYPGMTVLDAQGIPTEVLGVIFADRSSVKGYQDGISEGCWVQRNVWTHESGTSSVPPGVWMALLTASGTYRVQTFTGSVEHIRDFSDVGLSNIASTFSWVLNNLQG